MRAGSPDEKTKKRGLSRGKGKEGKPIRIVPSGPGPERAREDRRGRRARKTRGARRGRLKGGIETPLEGPAEGDAAVDSHLGSIDLGRKRGDMTLYSPFLEGRDAEARKGVARNVWG